MNTPHGPMDVRIMQGKPGGGANRGPRTITTRPGTSDYVYPSGKRITGNKLLPDRRAIGHIYGQQHETMFEEKNENLNLTRFNEISKHWLNGAIFIGFTFSSYFTLSFSRQRYNQEIPHEFDIIFLEKWWIGDEKEWNEKVLNREEGVEPGEPVKAFELAKLRWVDGSSIERVALCRNVLNIEMDNKISISARSTGEDEYCFGVFGRSGKSLDSNWSIIFDGDHLHIRVPNNLPKK